MKKIEVLLLTVFLLAGFVVRLYRVQNPIGDWHSWRQADTSAVSRNFVQHGFDILHPTYDDISNVQTGFDNPQGYRFVEFPIYNVIQAGLYTGIGILTLEEWGRLITIFASLGGALCLFLLLRKRNKLAAWFALIFSLFLPYNIYYGRTILPDTSMVSAVIAGIFFFDLWVQHGGKSKAKNITLYFVFSMLFFMIGLLLKPYALFYGLPLLVLVFNKWSWRLLLKPQVYIYAFFVLAPFGLWRWWEAKSPEGIPAYTWLFNGNGIRFRPSFFRWIFYERLTKLISGYVNILFVVTGIIGVLKEKDKIFLFSIPLSALIYACVLATGNVQHDYYQIVAMPGVCLLMGFGSAWFIRRLSRYTPKITSIGITLIIILTGFWFSWNQVKDYFNINNWSIVNAGIAVDKLTPKNAKIVAPYDGDTSFLYQTKRKGWPAFEHPLPQLVQMGAGYLVLVNPQPKDYDIGKTYKIVSATKDYILFDLHQKP